MEEGENSKFRVNVDGDSGVSFERLVIAPEDSAFVFIEVTIDGGNNESLPFILEENLLFNANGTEQNVKLIAWGQNAHFHIGGEIQINQDGSVNYAPLPDAEDLACDEMWNSDLPHVIFGTLLVPETCCLTINEGTQVYCHSGAGILVNGGCIDVNGDLGNEVVFQGDRLEMAYDDLPGQWGIEIAAIANLGFGNEVLSIARGGIWLSVAAASEMDYAIIKNASIGLQVDSTGASGEDVLQLRNCIIHNHSVAGVIGQGATMSGFNNLFANCGQSAAAFQLGGEYKFDHCSFLNYWTGGARQAPAFILNNYYETVDDEIITRSLGNSRFRNCVFYGSNASLSEFGEFILDVDLPENENYKFENCVVDTEQDISDGQKFMNVSNNIAPSFISTADFDFRPTSNSVLREAGIPIGGALTLDLIGTSRADGFLPDIGCLEFTQP